MKSELESFWNGYYADQAFSQDGDPDLMLDYDNQPLTSQAQAVMMDGIGPVIGKSLIDVGCGWGYFARTIQAMGGTVTGLEQVSEMVTKLAERWPQINWVASSILEKEKIQQLGQFDVVTAIESLQYVDFGTAVKTLWNSVAPGGRLVSIIPNAECSIAQRAVTKFDGKYIPVSPDQIAETLDALDGVELWRYRGLTFGEDQRLQPYVVSPWFGPNEETTWIGTPNRLAFVAKKSKN